MADVWECSIDYSIPSYTGNPVGHPEDGLTGEFAVEFHVVGAAVGSGPPEFAPAIDYGCYCVSVGINPDGTCFMGLQQYQDDAAANPQPLFWSGFSGAPTMVLSSSFQSTVLGGGTLTLTKDFAHDILTATSPLGTITLTLSDLDPFVSPSYNNNVPIIPWGYGAQFAMGPPTTSPPFSQIPVDDEVKFSNIVAKQNGTTYQTIALTPGDPGHWWVNNTTVFDPLVGNVNGPTSPYWSLTQETLDQKITGSLTSGELPTRFTIYGFWRNLTLPGSPGLASTRAPDHGAIWSAYVDPTNAATLKVRKTFDKGQSWQESTLYMAAGGANNQSPSLAYLGGRLFAVWYDGAEILQSNSRDLGTNWSTPVTLPISGTNPLLLVDPSHGLQYYFYVDGSGNLQLVRSATFGNDFIDASPHLVASGVGAQTVAAQFAPDGSLLVGYIASGAWTQTRSKDLGLTWS